MTRATQYALVIGFLGACATWPSPRPVIAHHAVDAEPVNANFEDVPCAAGEVKLQTTVPQNRCAESEDEAGCDRDAENEAAAWRTREGVTHVGYVIESCTLAHDWAFDGTPIRAGGRLMRE